MKKVLNRNMEAGSRKSNEPRLLGSIVSEMLHSNSPLARGYRQYIASQENVKAEAKGWHANTELGCELKTLLRSDKRAQPGKSYLGVLRFDSDAVVDEFISRDPHFTFIETQPRTAYKRNPRLFNGRFITVTCRADGSLRLNFRNVAMGRGFNVRKYAAGVAAELCQALSGLLEELTVDK